MGFAMPRRGCTMEGSATKPAFWRAVRDLRSCTRGAAALEFALVCTPLMLTVFGFIAVSGVFTTWTSMQSNTQYAARIMSTGQIKSWSTTATTCPTTDKTKVEYYACNGLPSWAVFTATVSQDCTVPSVTVKLSANTQKAAITDAMNIFGSTAIISAQSVIMKEGGTCP
jgi:Flp pilus assembly protein TadG